MTSAATPSSLPSTDSDLSSPPPGVRSEDRHTILPSLSPSPATAATSVEPLPPSASSAALHASPLSPPSLTQPIKGGGLLRVYFVRHGQSFNNVATQGGVEEPTHHDPDLTPLGFDQAEAAASRIAEEVRNATTIYSSYQLRALRTMAAIHRKLPHLRAIIRRDLHEVGGCISTVQTAKSSTEGQTSGGASSSSGKVTAFPGLSSSEVNRMFPHFKEETPCPNGWWEVDNGRETRDEAYERAYALVDELKAMAEERASLNQEPESIIIVSHLKFQRMLLKLLEETVAPPPAFISIAASAPQAHFSVMRVDSQHSLTFLGEVKQQTMSAGTLAAVSNGSLSLVVYEKGSGGTGGGGSSQGSHQHHHHGGGMSQSSMASSDGAAEDGGDGLICPHIVFVGCTRHLPPPPSPSSAAATPVVDVGTGGASQQQILSAASS